VAPGATGSAGASAAATPKPKRRGRGWLWAGVATVSVVALGAGGMGLMNVLNLGGSSNLPECAEMFTVPESNVPIELLTTADVVCTTSSTGFDYTAPVTGLTDRSVIFDFPSSTSLADAASAAGTSADGQSLWGFSVFGDAGLTVELPYIVSDNADGSGWAVESAEAPGVNADYSFADSYKEANGITVDRELLMVRDNYETEDNADGATFITQSQWGFRDVYYLVRYVDKAGKPLDRPVVSEFSFEHKLDTPYVTYGDDPTSPGTIELTWDPVEGADRYLIIKGSNFLDDDLNFSGLRNYELLGSSTGTKWSALESIAASDTSPSSDNYGNRQNVGLQLFDFSDDNPSADAAETNSHNADYELGVIAIADANDGEEGDVIASALAAQGSAQIATGRAFEIAENTWFDTYGGDHSLGTEFASFDDIPTTVPVVAMDGHIAQASAVLVAATVLNGDKAVRPGVFQVGLFAAGTQLGVRVLIEVPPGEDIFTKIDDFNSRSATDSGKTDAMVSTLSHFVIDDATILATAPAIDYPVQGTHPFVEFLASHMVARTEAVDLSAWLEQPGLPDIYDAVYEAWYQNPYVYVAAVSLQGNILYLKYSYEDGDYQQHQAELKANVEATVASIITDGMSAHDKAVAINQYLVDNVEYDYAALETMEGWSYDSTGQTWQEYAGPNGALHAWEANGTWDQHTVVCAGYAISFVALSMEANLVTVYVSGVVTFNNGGHAWNKVNVDGTWYAVDSTWNDSPQGNKYLLISDSGFTDYATRTEGDLWVVDNYIPNFATP